MIDQITGRQHGNENFLGPRICRKYLGVQTWRVKNEKIEKEKKGRQGEKIRKFKRFYSGLKTTTCLITF